MTPSSRRETLTMSSSSGGERLELWQSITNSWKTLQKKSEKNIGKLGLCLTEFKILKVVSTLGPVPMARLSGETLLTQPAITLLVDKLESQGFVRRERSEDDRRVTNIAVTTKGRVLFREANSIHRRFVRDMLSELTEGEIIQLRSIFEKLASTAARLQPDSASAGRSPRC